ncbi:MAG: UDP-N-acetylmuramate--L-alanine ligase [Actinomadura sp.]
MESRTVRRDVAEVTEPMTADLSRPHFVGIGGAGMSALAQVCAAQGARVTGSDVQDSPRMLALAATGCGVHVGHSAERVAGASCVVVSTAISEDNPEVVAAIASGIPVIHRAQALAAVMADRRSVAVTGTHGKSTTTAMLAAALEEAGEAPSFVIGADLAAPGASARLGNSSVFVAEADESDRSFWWLRPDVAVVVNVDDDHPENYGGVADHLDAFERFVSGITPGGVLVVNADDAGARALTERVRAGVGGRRIITYGIADDADVRIAEIESTGSGSITTLRAYGGHVRIRLAVPGRHMAHNAVAAFAAAGALGVEPSKAATGLGAYRGVRRRLTLHGRAGGVMVVDSYAHHPTAMAADLETVREMAGEHGRTLVVCQPSGAARVAAFGAEMGRVLASADAVVLTEVYTRRGDDVPGVTNRTVADAVAEHDGTVICAHDRDDIAAAIIDLARPGDVVVTMGAGDITTLGPVLCDRLTRVMIAPS